MQMVIFSLLVVTGPSLGDLSRGTSAMLRAEAQPASVELTPVSGDRPVRLPALGFSLTVEPACGGDAEPRSLSISVADTRLHFTAEELASATVVEATLILPRRQLAPVRIDHFCRAGVDDGPSRFVLEDAFTARLSLRCGPDDRQTIVYETLPLDVELQCRRAEAGPVQPPDPPEPFESF